MSIGPRPDSYLKRFNFAAKTGICSINDRVQTDGGWGNRTRDLDAFRALFDFPNMMTGWIYFPEKAAPDLRLVRLGEEHPQGPGGNFKVGLRILLLLDNPAETKPREFISTAAVVWDAIDELHNAHEAGAGEHPSELPVVELDDVVVIETSQATVYQPRFVITGGAPRPAYLPAKGIPPASPAPRKPAVAAAAGAPVDLDDEIPF